ncbi:MAG: type II toxin-antitoxin system YhaV family toxin [Desulfobacteraceae bacterium]|nr:type II toxin-antitoxin system YhaV family toxin [Desulfobacteraceae bacterium]
MIINGWKIGGITQFNERFNELVTQVEALKKEDREGYKSHRATKLLKSILETIEDIAKNPFHEKFRLGKTLGTKYAHWRRAKNILPKRYRLFFRAHTPDRIVILGWINDETTLRKDGDKNDVYNVFKHMLDAGDVPNDIQALKKQAKDPLTPQKSE